MPAHVLGQRVDDDVGAVRERPLEHRAEQGVVAHHHRALPLGRPDPVRRGVDQGEVHHGVERVGGGLDHDHADAAPRRRALSGPVDRRGARAVGEALGADPVRGEGAGEQRLGAAVERLAVQHDVPGRAKASAVVAIAAIPEANTRAASPPSYTARRSSTISLLGWLKRE